MHEAPVDELARADVEGLAGRQRGVHEARPVAHRRERGGRQAGERAQAVERGRVTVDARAPARVLVPREQNAPQGLPLGRVEALLQGRQQDPRLLEELAGRAAPVLCRGLSRTGWAGMSRP